VLCLYVEDLADLPFDAVMGAIKRLRRDPKITRFPLPAIIRDRVAPVTDSRPGAEEAWAMLPRSEDETAVWTIEMRDAYGVARGLMADDHIAARMAFREAYDRLVRESRARGVAARWEVSQGIDPNQRVRAIQEAVRRGLITREYARNLLPELAPVSSVPQIEGPACEQDSERQRLRIRELLENVTRQIPLEQEGA
jgi:hypothetical protein